MKKSGAVKSITLVVMLVLLFTSACKSNRKSWEGETYTSLDGQKIVKIESYSHLSIKEGSGPKVVAKYTIENGNKLRIALPLMDKTELTIYYRMIDNAIIDPDGTVLYSPGGLEKIALDKGKRANEALEGAMVEIKGGCFDMGDTFGDGDSDEKPAHRVCLDDFDMDKYEVTQSAFESVMGVNRSAHKDCPDCPVENVTWDEAKEYCEKVDKQLPTSAQWEYSARDGGKKARYGTGKDNISKRMANYGSSGTMPIGMYPPNASGLCDMAGNVWEWTADRYGEDYGKRKKGEKNPEGPAKGDFRVFRGGAWNGNKYTLRSSYRGSSAPDKQSADKGFRCAQPTHPAPSASPSSPEQAQE